MTYLTAFALIIIIVLASIIVFNLYRENSFIREATKKETISEGFENAETTQQQQMKNTSDNLNFPLREFIIKSSYNSAINENKASKEQLTELINRGVRVFDFEIYTRDNTEYVSYSSDVEYKRIETDLTLTVDTAFSHIASKAFIQTNAGPVFIHLRVKTPSANTFQRLSSIIQKTFGSRLLPASTEVNGSTLFNDLVDKVVIMHDQTSGNKPSNHPCIEKCVQYVDLVNIYSGTIDLPLYTHIEYTESMGLTKKVSIDPKTGRTDIDTFYMVAPSSFETRCASRKKCGITSLIETMKTKPCQMLLMSSNDEELDIYENIFKTAGTSYCLVSSYIEMLNEKNVET
jgi:type II secretory pathway pseudopilin PulG